MIIRERVKFRSIISVIPAEQVVAKKKLWSFSMLLNQMMLNMWKKQKENLRNPLV